MGIPDTMIYFASTLPHPQAKCTEINDGFSEEEFDIHADFNVGFSPHLWKEWLDLKGRPVLPPIQEALELVKPKNNFLEIHR